MARVIAPNKEYNGVSAGVRFVNGEAECSDKWTLKWFKAHGYTVEEADEQSDGNDEAEENGNSEGEENTATDIGAANEEKAAAAADDKSEGNAAAISEVSEEKGDTSKSNVKSRGRRKAEK